MELVGFPSSELDIWRLTLYLRIAKPDIRYVLVRSAVVKMKCCLFADWGNNSRLARRGGVKRISATIYEEARLALVSHLKTVRGSSIQMLQNWPG